ncbi:MAG: hypothetical protein GEU73_11115 [Chloroflexi bacterium]|nr:hypothetical protein [Chloroflexota bacterium]
MTTAPNPSSDSSAPNEPRAARKSQAEQLVKLAKNAGIETFHSPERIAYASVNVSDGVASHTETWAIRSTGFRQWLRKIAYEAKLIPNREAQDTARDILEAGAIYAGPEEPVFTRIGHKDGRVYLDLADRDWRIVGIGPTGWHVMQDSPVKFVRTPGMLPLPEPAAKHLGSVDRLQRFVNVQTDDDFILFVACLLGAFHPHGPYPVLSLTGEAGSGKDTAVKVFRRLIDPNLAPVRTDPRNEHELVIAARNGWVISLGNLSGIPSWLSDGLCRLSTGSGFSTRRLYTDDEEAIFQATRPVVLNSIGELARRGDLLQRTLGLTLGQVEEERRLRESEFWPAFEAELPVILSGLLNGVYMALALGPHTTVERLPRMADFAHWVAAAESAFGWEDGAFLRAYRANIKVANQTAIDGSLIGPHIRDLIATGEVWTGTASDLLRWLNGRVDEKTQAMDGWPKDGTRVSNALRALMPHFRAEGIVIEFGQRSARGRPITIAPSGSMWKSASQRHSRHENDDAGDDADPSQRHSASLQRHTDFPDFVPENGANDADDASDAEIQTFSDGSSDEGLARDGTRSNALWPELDEGSQHFDDAGEYYRLNHERTLHRGEAVPWRRSREGILVCGICCPDDPDEEHRSFNGARRNGHGA